MTINLNTLDYVRRIENFEQRLEFILTLDDSLFEDFEVFKREEHDSLPYSPDRCDFRFKDYVNEYSALIVGAKIPHHETSSEEFIAGYEGNVFQLCKGISNSNPNQDYVVGIIVAQSVGDPFEISDLIAPKKLEKEVQYMRKVFKKMGLSKLSNHVSIYLNSCYF